MTGIILYISVHRPRSLIIFKYILSIAQYWIVYQLSERRTLILLKLMLLSVKGSAEKQTEDKLFGVVVVKMPLSVPIDPIGNQLPPKSATF